MLAYSVQWHLLEAWRGLLLSDEKLKVRLARDPVAQAKCADDALKKAHVHRLDDGVEAHGFQTLLAEPCTIVNTTCRRTGRGEAEPTFSVVTTPSPQQQRALDLAAATCA